MSDIEEDIKICNRIAKQTREAAECSLGYPSDSREWKEEAQAIENVLNELSRLQELDKIRLADIDASKEIICELEEQLEKKDKNIEEMLDYIDFDMMPFKCNSLCVKEGCQEKCIREFFKRKFEDK